MTGQNIHRFEATINADGKLDVTLPYPTGTKVIVTVAESGTDDFADLVAASGASLDFWDNVWDDEDWNNG